MATHIQEHVALILEVEAFALAEKYRPLPFPIVEEGRWWPGSCWFWSPPLMYFQADHTATAFGQAPMYPRGSKASKTAPLAVHDGAASHAPKKVRISLITSSGCSSGSR